MKQVRSRENVAATRRHLRKKKKKAAGVDGMSRDEFLRNFPVEIKKIQEALAEGYHPDDLRKAVIPQLGPGDRSRGIKILTASDSCVQRLLNGPMHREVDPMLSSSCCAYRPGRQQLDAVRSFQAIASQYGYVLQADVSDFFNSIPLHRVMMMLTGLVEPKLATLIYTFMRLGSHWDNNSGWVGLPQGTPLAPILSNLYMTNFDWFWMRKGAVSLRYCDDILVFTRSYKQAVSAYDLVEKTLRKQGLSLHPKKTKPVASHDAVFLGYGLTRDFDLRIAKSSVERFKWRTMERLEKYRTTRPSDPIKKELAALRGWSNYFYLSTTSRPVGYLDQWHRRTWIRFVEETKGLSPDNLPSLAEVFTKVQDRRGVGCSSPSSR